jgi:chemotaxis signal transduction protein
MGAMHPSAAVGPDGSAGLAQGVMCGPWALAFPYSWARSIVEEVELSEVPHAPPWLLGAANIDGKVVPVFDLGLWVDASHGIERGPGTYLLIGGEGDDTAGLLFRGLPALLKPCGDTNGAPQLAALPAALMEFVRGSALDAGGRPHALIDAVALLDTWAAELALA